LPRQGRQSILGKVKKSPKRRFFGIMKYMKIRILIILIILIGLSVGGLFVYQNFLVSEKGAGQEKGTEESRRAVNLYYYNPELDKDESGNIACSRNGLVAVEREIPITKTPIQDTIKLLLLGELTDEERVQGIDTEYPLEGLSLKGASLKDGILTLEFDDPNSKTVGGACRIGILWFQIEATAKQFPEVQGVSFLPEEIFQP